MFVTALATPFKNGKIDCLSYEKLVDFQQKNGADALLAVGTTAEALLLNECEKKLLIRLAKGVAPNIPLWVGVDDCDTRKAADSARIAQQLGANGVLLTPPHFVKCTPQGYILHVRAVARAIQVPLMLYNAPNRCGYTLDKRALCELAQDVQYLKDAGDDLSFTAAFADKMTVLCGNDKLLSQMLDCGAKGVVSVVGNVAPKLTKQVLCNAATELQRDLFVALAKLSMQEVSPVAVKYMLFKSGIFDAFEVRLPLTKANETTCKAIDEINWENVK